MLRAAAADKMYDVLQVSYVHELCTLPAILPALSYNLLILLPCA